MADVDVSLHHCIVYGPTGRAKLIVTLSQIRELEQAGLRVSDTYEAVVATPSLRAALPGEETK